jgi:hypothetical protein
VNSRPTPRGSGITEPGDDYQTAMSQRQGIHNVHKLSAFNYSETVIKISNLST